MECSCDHTQIVTASHSDLQDYTYYFVPAPWLTVKLMRLLQCFSIPGQCLQLCAQHTCTVPTGQCFLGVGGIENFQCMVIIAMANTKIIVIVTVMKLSLTDETSEYVGVWVVMFQVSVLCLILSCNYPHFRQLLAVIEIIVSVLMVMIITS